MNEATEPTGTTGGWMPELRAAHAARIELMDAMGQGHYSRTDARWHVEHFRKMVTKDLEQQVEEARKILAVIMDAGALEDCGKLGEVWMDRIRTFIQPVTEKKVSDKS